MERSKDNITRQGSIQDFAASLSAKDVKLMKDLFSMCDVDGDGELRQDELGRVMKDLGIHFTEGDLDSLFEQLDVDENGTVSFEEFLRGLKFMEKSSRLDSLSRSKGIRRENSVASFVETLTETQVDQMKNLFEMIDTNNDGVVTKRELAQVMAEMGLNTTREEVNELFNNLDTNGDGRVEFPEFMAGMRWLKKGSILNSTTSPRTTKRVRTSSKNSDSASPATQEDERLVTDLKERSNILQNCLKEIVTRGMRLAEENYRKKEYEQAKIALDTLDLDTLIAMEVFVGSLTTDKQRDHYKKMKRRLDTLPGK